MDKTYILTQDVAGFKGGKKKQLYAKAGDRVSLLNTSNGVAIVQSESGNRFSCQQTFLKVADPTELKTR